MKDLEKAGNLLCYWSNLKDHPKCIHGPTLLFGRENQGDITKFFACSACRDRKLCLFYLEYGRELTKQQKKSLEQETKKNLSSFNHQKLFILYNRLLSEHSSQRAYCHSCETLLFISEKQKHNDHEITENLTDYQLMHPSEILKPLENSKKEAQYLFSNKAVLNIVNLLISLEAENVLCIGTPRIHEYISNNLEGKIASLLLDIDGRFHNFFGPLNYCWYNLLNHFFFQENSENVFKDFLKHNQGKKTFLICDPPFGARVEPISQTIKTISELHKKINKINDTENELKIFFIFPYFMEGIMKEKSNPPNINGGLKDLKMTDYKVEYDNHPLFVSKINNQQQGSQVRIFTNVPLNLIKLPESDGYKYCKRCQRWVASENKHCKICHSCTSKDGRRYRHCKVCQRCVKPSWQHCKKCERCLLPNHKCGKRPNIGKCFKCNKIGHTEKECIAEDANECSKLKLQNKTKKRKCKLDNNLNLKKKKFEFSENNLKVTKSEINTPIKIKKENHQDTVNRNIGKLKEKLNINAIKKYKSIIKQRRNNVKSPMISSITISRNGIENINTKVKKIK